MFAYGEKVLLIDAKKRRYLFTLKTDGEFHTHSGFLRHSEVVGSQDGSGVRSTLAVAFRVLRPTLAVVVR
ncbi:MAG: tRNA (adenine-N1)-methyltransferase, partial [Acidimicrobiaceae bacterium]